MSKIVRVKPSKQKRKVPAVQLPKLESVDDLILDDDNTNTGTKRGGKLSAYSFSEYGIIPTHIPLAFVRYKGRIDEQSKVDD